MEAILAELNRWASDTPTIRRVWIFGSRARGEARPDSDLDVAIELYVLTPHESPTEVWFENAGAWRNEISELFPFRVDLELLDDSSTPTILSGTLRDGVLAYEAAA